MRQPCGLALVGYNLIKQAGDGANQSVEYAHFSEPNHTAKAPVMDAEHIEIIELCWVDRSSKDMPHSITRMYMMVITNIISRGKIRQAKNCSTVSVIRFPFTKIKTRQTNL